MLNLTELKPARVFKFFEEICGIPHGTGHTDGLSDYIEELAKKLSLRYLRDNFGNLVIYKDACLGNEGETIVLQEHLDMAAGRDTGLIIRQDEKEKRSELSVIDDYIYARGTVLGADGGIGIAYILALLEAQDISHPPIEALFTVDADAGMKGVREMDLSVIKGRRMINFGHFNEGEILMGCAGERRISCEVPVRYESEFGTLYDIVICGLNGGHSGLEIDMYRGNANMMMGRLLHYIDLYMDYSLAYLKGGKSYNHIPREAKASILIKTEDADKLETLIDRFNEELLKEYRFIEDNLTIYCENKDELVENVLTEKTKQRVIFMLLALPDGIVKMNPEYKDIVQTSSNAGMMSLERNSFVMHISIRSLLSSEKHALCDKFKFLTETIGGKFHVTVNYHAWEYQERSALRESLIYVYFRMYNENPKLTMIHSGLECGIISDKIRDMDIVSIGPTIENVNTDKERLCISSVERTWDFLVRLLEAL